MICLGMLRYKKAHGNWKCIDTDLKTVLTLLMLIVSLSLIAMFILSTAIFQYYVNLFAFVLKESLSLRYPFFIS